MSENPKPCMKCRFYDESWGAACINPALRISDPVEGYLNAFPRTARAAHGSCGEEGRHFAPRLSLLDRLTGRNR